MAVLLLFFELAINFSPLFLIYFPMQLVYALIWTHYLERQVMVIHARASSKKDDYPRGLRFLQKVCQEGQFLSLRVHFLNVIGQVLGNFTDVLESCFHSCFRVE